MMQVVQQCVEAHRSAHCDSCGWDSPTYADGVAARVTDAAHLHIEQTGHVVNVSYGVVMQHAPSGAAQLFPTTAVTVA